MRKKDQSTSFIKICLADALIKCMERGMTFDEINVKDICVLADVGRTTYYRHFDNKSGKENLIIFKVYSCWKEYCETRQEELKESQMKVLLSFFYEEKELFLLLAKNNLTMTAIFNVLYRAIGPTAEDTRESAYWKSFLSCSIFGIIYHWLQTDFADSPEYVYDLISKVYPK